MAIAPENGATGVDEKPTTGRLLRWRDKWQKNIYSCTVRSAHPLRCDMGVCARVDFEIFCPRQNAEISTQVAYALMPNEFSYAGRRFFESFKCL
jgi:hypothetical protein